MKRFYPIRKVFAVVFPAIVLFTVSVHETHYLFSEHPSVNEHCENHLHQTGEHSPCTVCKFDASFFTDELAVANPQHILFPDVFTSLQPETIISFSYPVVFLRGPPLPSA